MDKNKSKHGKLSRKNRKPNNFWLKGTEMVTFREANQARTSLKIPLSYYSWCKGLSVESENGHYFVTVLTTHIDNAVKSAVPPFHKGVSVRIEPES